MTIPPKYTEAEYEAVMECISHGVYPSNYRLRQLYIELTSVGRMEDYVPKHPVEYYR